VRRYTVNVRTPGALPLPERVAPGRRVTVDGRPAAAFRHDALFLAVPVLSGTRTIEVRYDPVSFRLGILVSLAALAAIGALLVAPAVRAHARP